MLLGERRRLYKFIFPSCKGGKTLQALAWTLQTHTQWRMVLQHWTGISTYSSTHWGLHNPYTQLAWDTDILCQIVGGKANSFLPAEGYTDNYYTTLGWPMPSCLRKLQRFPNCLLFARAVGLQLLNDGAPHSHAAHWGDSMKYRNLAAAYEPGAISLAEEAEYRCHVKPQPKLMCSTKLIDSYWTHWLSEFFMFIFLPHGLFTSTDT